MANKIKIKKNDTVEVIAGKDKGKRGMVLRVLPSSNRVIVQGLNMQKKAMRRKSQQDRGGIMEIETPIHVSNVMIVGKNGPTRIGYKMEGDKKIRICRKTGEAL